MKKICMVVYSYYLYDPRVRREAEALAQEGFRINCFCLRGKGQAKFEKVHDVNIFRLPLSKYRGSSSFKYALSYFWFFVLSFFAVTISYLKRRYHIVQFHTLPDFIVLSGIVPKLFGAKLVLDMHEIMPEFFISKFGIAMSHPFVKVLKFIEKICVSFSDAVIVVNDPIKRILVERCNPRSEITVVMNTADESIFRSDYPKHLEKSNGFIVMYHGTLTSLYGVDIAIRSIAKLKDNIPDLEFRIFGSETEAVKLKELAEKLGVSCNVSFLGIVERKAIPKYITEADIGILPTVKDGFINLSFSNKLAEYVSMKIPVVATRLDSTQEYFTEDAISYFESGNVDALTSRILELYVSPQKRLLQAEKAYQQYQRIRWSVMRKQYIELLDSLISR
jgi:glycosyltransferase involved in cell wall biosynthesis